LIIGAVVTTTFTFLLYGLTNPPIVDYTLHCSSSFDPRYSTRLTVVLEVRNRGHTDAPLLLVLTVQNATIFPIDKPWAECTDSRIKLYVIAMKNSEQYSAYAVDIVVDSSYESFTLTYSIEKRFDPSISGVISLLFAEFHGFYPTSVTYVKDAEGRYNSQE